MPDTTDIDGRVEEMTRAEESEPKKSFLAGRAGRMAIALLVGVVGAAIAAVEINDRVTNIHEVDARVSADLVTMSSRVAGWVTHMGVREGDQITPGQILVTIDSRETELQLEEIEARIQTTEAERLRTLAERDLADQETAARVASEEARLEAARVAVSSLDPQLALARREMERAKNLFEKRVSSRRQLDQAETELTIIEREHRLARAELRAVEANLLEARAERARLTVLDSELAIFTHRRAELAAQRDELRLDLEDRTIRSPITGIVDATFVEAGEYVSEGQRLTLIHDPQNVWVDANIKETQIRKIKVGDPVDVSVDAYPGREFTAQVEVIGSSTTAEFALLPSPNPSGNFTKITQRLPVRIAIDQQENLLRPGMMVEIKITPTGEPRGQ